MPQIQPYLLRKYGSKRKSSSSQKKKTFIELECKIKRGCTDFFLTLFPAPPSTMQCPKGPMTQRFVGEGAMNFCLGLQGDLTILDQPKCSVLESFTQIYPLEIGYIAIEHGPQKQLIYLLKIVIYPNHYQLFNLIIYNC